MAYHEVASLIHRGDTIFIVEPDGPDVYRTTDKVRIKPGQHEYLENFGDDVSPSGTLMALPTYC